jgi:hypothetical protein
MQERTALQQITTDAESGRASMPLRACNIDQGSRVAAGAAAVEGAGAERLSSRRALAVFRLAGAARAQRWPVVSWRTWMRHRGVCKRTGATSRRPANESCRRLTARGRSHNAPCSRERWAATCH